MNFGRQRRTTGRALKTCSRRPIGTRTTTAAAGATGAAVCKTNAQRAMTGVCAHGMDMGGLNGGQQRHQQHAQNGPKRRQAPSGGPIGSLMLPVFDHINPCNQITEDWRCRMAPKLRPGLD
jgi:hypothetical protein